MVRFADHAKNERTNERVSWNEWKKKKISLMIVRRSFFHQFTCNLCIVRDDCTRTQPHSAYYLYDMTILFIPVRWQSIFFVILALMRCCRYFFPLLLVVVVSLPLSLSPTYFETLFPFLFSLDGCSGVTIFFRFRLAFSLSLSYFLVFLLFSAYCLHTESTFILKFCLYHRL